MEKGPQQQNNAPQEASKSKKSFANKIGIGLVATAGFFGGLQNVNAGGNDGNLERKNAVENVQKLTIQELESAIKNNQEWYNENLEAISFYHELTPEEIKKLDEYVASGSRTDYIYDLLDKRFGKKQVYTSPVVAHFLQFKNNFEPGKKHRITKEVIERLINDLIKTNERLSKYNEGFKKELAELKESSGGR